MEALLDSPLGLIVLIGAIVLVIGVLIPNRPQPDIIYVPISLSQPRGGSGCLPTLLIGIVILLGALLALAQ
jgi:hypothetical protein